MTEIVISMVPVAVTREDAASALGMSLDSFERFVQPEIRLIRKGRMRLVPVAELQQWAERNAEQVLDTTTTRRTTL